MLRGRSRTGAAIFAVSVMSILIMAGCGGSGSRAQGPELPRSVYVDRANAVCATAARQITDGASKVFANPGKAGTQDEALVETYAKSVVLPALYKEYSELVSLRPTSDSNPRLTLDELEKSIDKWEMDKAIMGTVNDTSFVRFDAMANDFGLTMCAGTDGLVRSITTGEPLPS